MTEQVRRRTIALDGLVDELGEEVEHLLGGRAFRYIVVDARLGQRLRRLLDDLVPAAAVQQDVQGAYVRAAEVEREEVADLLARRQGDVGAQHAQRGGLALKTHLHLRLEVSGDFLKVVIADAEGGEDFIVFLLVHGHDCSPFNRSSVPAWLRRLGKLLSLAFESLLAPSSAYSRRTP